MDNHVHNYIEYIVLITQSTMWYYKYSVFHKRRDVDNVEDVNKYEQMTLIDDKNEDASISTSFKKKKRRQKITIELDDVLVGLHFLSIPFALIGRQNSDDIGTLEVRWTDSKGGKHGLDIIGSNEYGLPTSFDRDVLIALFKIYSEENNLIEYNYKDKKYEMPIVIKFTYSELARIMGLSVCGKNVKRLQQSIRRLATITMANKYEGGIYDPTTKSYITNAEKSYKMLDYEMYQYSKLKKNEKRLNAASIKENNYVTIDQFFYKSMCNGYFRIINYSDYKGLKLNISKRIYLLLESWGGRKTGVSKFHYYNTLYDWIPLSSEQSIALKNRYIRDAAEELKQIGYIQEYEVEEREKGKGINFIYDYSEYIVDKSDPYNLEKYKATEDVVIALSEIGFNQSDIEMFLKKRDISYIKALLRLYDVNKKHEQIKKSPKGWIIQGIYEPYDIDKKYYDTQHNVL